MPSAEGGPSVHVVLQAFHQAADAASALLRSAQVEAAWAEPSALRGLTVGGVAAHLYAAVRRLEVSLDQPLPRQPVLTGLADFYGINRAAAGGGAEPGGRGDPAGRGGAYRADFHAQLAEDAERRARYGHRAVAERFVGMLDRVGPRLDAEPPSRLVPVVQVADGVTPLVDYARTRVVELVVHADDLAVSVGMATPSTPLASEVAIGVLVELARARAGDQQVIRAMTRIERADPEATRVL